MRLLFVNYVHPDTPHVSGMRLRYFAEAMARRGHRVVLLTRTLGEADPVPTPDRVAETLETHDWSRPYHLACAPVRRWSLDRIRSRKTPRPLRQALVAWHYLAGEGLFSDWTEGTRPYWPMLAERFRPQATWGTFGNVDSWVIAQGVARQAGAPWVMDVKDGWETFIPFGFRRHLARRFAGAFGMTANSRFFGSQFERWFPHRAAVVYSGADDWWFESPEEDGNEVFRITLVGSTYGRDHLRGFVAGVGRWLLTLSEDERNSVVLTYAGQDGERVRAACEAVELPCRRELRGYVGQEALAALCRVSAVNAYIWSPATFHHKVIELLCARRPVISFPGEYEEARELAKRVGGKLAACGDSSAVAEALESLWSDRNASYGAEESLQEFSWRGQAERLEALFMQVAGDAARATP